MRVQPKSQRAAGRGMSWVTPAPAAARGEAEAQALNQAPDSIPAMVKPGEFVVPPDTVHAMGGPQALQGVVDATHTPAPAAAMVPQDTKPKLFFADGGLVEDQAKRPSSFGDAAAAASNPGVTQVSTQAPAAPPLPPASPAEPPAPKPAPMPAAQGMGALASVGPTAAPGAAPGAPASSASASGAVTRVGNSYSGGNVGGDLSINGQPAGGGYTAAGGPGARGMGAMNAARPADAGVAPTNWTDAIAKVEAMGFKQNPAQPPAPIPAPTSRGMGALMAGSVSPAPTAAPGAALGEEPGSPVAHTAASKPAVMGGDLPAPQSTGGQAGLAGWNRQGLTNAEVAQANPQGVVTARRGANGTMEFSGSNVSGPVSYADQSGKALPGGGLGERGFADPSEFADGRIGARRSPVGMTTEQAQREGLVGEVIGYDPARDQRLTGARGMGVMVQNMAAADALAGRQQQESTGRIAAQGMAWADSAQAPGTVAPIVRHSGNDWQARNDLRNAQVSASSITNSPQWGGMGKSSPAMQNYAAALKADNDARAAQPGMDQAAMKENAALQRTGMQQQGENTRTRFQMTMADIRERRAAGQQATQNDLARQRLALDTARASRDGVPSGYRTRQDGQGLEAIPGGPADPNTPKGALNEGQSKALAFGARMQQSGQNLDGLAAQGVTQPGYIKRMADTVGAGAMANWTQSPEQQQVEQSQRDFVNAVLRKESGAAISNSEFSNAKNQYFAQPGDSPEVIEQKRANRELATRGMLAEVPNAQSRVQQVTGPSQRPTGQQQRQIARTGTLNGRRVVQYGDGSISYAD